MSRRQKGAPTARALALLILERIEDDGAYANIVLPRYLDGSGLSTRDKAFATELVYGTTRMRRACDALVDRFTLREPEPEIRRLLRLGAYQLEFARIAQHAAVGETVELAPARARGFVNAILRNIARTPMIWPDEATRLSYPDWLDARLRAELGDDADAAMQRMNEPPPVNVRDDGYTQDRASEWIAASVGAQAGDVVFDVCAAPGGKATALAAAGAFVVAADISSSRAHLLTTNIDRLRSDAVVVGADATAPPFAPESFDHVLLDAPCSGLGALRRRADARWRIQPVDLVELAALQRAMLAAVAPLVRPAGTIVYSVCTVTAGESIDHPVPEGFDVVPAPPPGAWRPFGRGWRVLPQDDDTDGMVLIRYRRRHD